jgi:hypothetical protein
MQTRRRRQKKKKTKKKLAEPTDLHDDAAHVMRHHCLVEGGKVGEAEEHVYDVDGEVYVFDAVVLEHARQGTHERLILHQYFQVLFVPCELEYEHSAHDLLLRALVKHLHVGAHLVHACGLLLLHAAVRVVYPSVVHGVQQGRTAHVAGSVVVRSSCGCLQWRLQWRLQWSACASGGPV